MKYNNSFKYLTNNSLSELRGIAGEIRNEPAIAVDLEADSMYHFKERVCLLQIATARKVILIDPLPKGHLNPLKSVFGSNRIKKVFHGADYDIRSLYRDFGIEVSNLYDTQIAAMFTGAKEVGLNAVLKDRFGVETDKRYQKKDWSVRPLPKEMLSYAAMDVRYLLPLWKQLDADLRRQGRDDWVAEECGLLSRVRPAQPDKTPLYLRFKGAGKLSSRSLAVLESLLAHRVKAAEKKDRPLFKIVRNASLLHIAAEPPRNKKQLAEKGELSRKQLSMYGDGMMKAVQKAMSLPDDRLPIYTRRKSRPKPAKVSERIRRLKTWRESKAAKLRLDPSLVLTNAQAISVAETQPKTTGDFRRIPEIRKWQIREFGEEMLSVLG